MSILIPASPTHIKKKIPSGWHNAARFCYQMIEKAVEQENQQNKVFIKDFNEDYYRFLVRLKYFDEFAKHDNPEISKNYRRRLVKDIMGDGGNLKLGYPIVLKEIITVGPPGSVELAMKILLLKDHFGTFIENERNRKNTGMKEDANRA